MNFLSGKKTYIVGLLMIALGVAQGDSQLILNGLGFVFTRAAIAKV